MTPRHPISGVDPFRPGWRIATVTSVPTNPPDLSLTEWSVLGLIAEGDTYGFSIAKRFAPDGVAGRVWTIPRPLVYRAIETLTAEGLVESIGSEPGVGGPKRTLIRTTDAGRRELFAWLDRPIEHIRDARSHLLMKLLIIDRHHRSPALLVARQRAGIDAMAENLERQLAETEGFDTLLVRWRLFSVQTLDRFLLELGE